MRTALTPASTSALFIAMGCLSSVLATEACTTATCGMGASLFLAFMQYFEPLIFIAICLALVGLFIRYAIFRGDKQAPWLFRVAEWFLFSLVLLYLLSAPFKVYILSGYGGGLMWFCAAFVPCIAFNGLTLFLWTRHCAAPDQRVRFSYPAAAYIGLSLYVMLVAFYVHERLSRPEINQDPLYSDVARPVFAVQIFMTGYIGAIMATKTTDSDFMKLIFGGVAVTLVFLGVSFLMPLLRICTLGEYVLQPMLASPI